MLPVHLLFDGIQEALHQMKLSQHFSCSITVSQPTVDRLFDGIQEALH